MGLSHTIPPFVRLHQIMDFSNQFLTPENNLDMFIASISEHITMAETMETVLRCRLARIYDEMYSSTNSTVQAPNQHRLFILQFQFYQQKKLVSHLKEAHFIIQNNL